MDSGSGGIKAGNEKLPLETGDGNHHHLHLHNQFFQHPLKMVLLFAAVALSCLVLYHSAYPFEFFPSSYNPSSAAANLSSPVKHKEDSDLESVLKKASTADKTVILTTLNEAWAAQNSVFDIFLDSFRIGNGTSRFLKHLVVIALDQKAYTRCSAIHPHCYTLSTDGIDFSGEAVFMTQDYLKMMWRRIDFLRTVLDLGYNFVFTDADIMWFRDPFQHFYGDADFQIACDYFKGSSSDLNNYPNGGFNYVKSNTRTTHFYRFWYTSREKYPDMHDQDVLNMIKHDPYLTKIGLHIRFLDTRFYGGFCEPSRDFNEVCTMHANCCVGLENKIHDLRIMLDDWRKYKSLPPNQRALNRLSWRVPQDCRTSFKTLHTPNKNETQKTKS
ncbi:hypothetical protein RJ639_042150 [Escallonia herrerae]|uniref:Glycosyltransferase n=1 Tax=Escallonia herrerae TaxID=1293975 RepID=A0AA89B4Y3_9ASTE|nr:hypothetical protein RJ639_042150 [Escallonia herrerae]